MNNKKLTAYLLWAFGIAWVLQFVGSWLYAQGNTNGYQVIMMVVMYAPMAAALLCGSGLKGLGWKPRIRKNFKYILAALLFPAVLGTLGAVLYYLVCPAAFDPGFGYLTSQLGAAGLAQLESQGMTLPVYAAVSAVSSVTVVPFVNMLLALGEEAGWRGVMYPALKERFGRVKGRVLGGVIWGAWHWPVMILCGYEYGTGYWGEPISGMVLFCVFTVAAGILLDWVYEKTECIWLPALGHGAVNAFGSIPILFLDPAYTNRMLLGPAMIGIVAGLPLLLAAVWVCARDQKRADQ